MAGQGPFAHTGPIPRNKLSAKFLRDVGPSNMSEHKCKLRSPPVFQSLIPKANDEVVKQTDGNRLTFH